MLSIVLKAEINMFLSINFLNCGYFFKTDENNSIRYRLIVKSFKYFSILFLIFYFSFLAKSAMYVLFS